MNTIVMKGISPVIATVLLLLMAVAAVGGSWVWYQRQSSLVGGQTEEKINEQLAQQTGVSISLAGVYLGSTGNLSLIVNNAGASNVTLTGFKISEGSTSSVNVTASKVINLQSSGILSTIESCTTGNTIKVQLYAAGISTQEYLETCP